MHKKIISLVLAFLFVFSLVPVAAFSVSAASPVSYFVTEEAFDGKVAIIGLNPEVTSTNIEIPSKIDGVAVTEISKNAFQGKTFIKSIIIPEGVKVIGNDAFAGCTGLESISLPNSLEKIGDRAFMQCYSLDTVTIPKSVKTFGYNIFQGCPDITILCFKGSAAAEEFANHQGVSIVSKSATALEIYQNPAKVNYFKGQLIDLTGLVLKVTYNDGTYEFKDSGYSYYYDFSEVALASPVRIEYAGVMTTLYATVSDWPDPEYDTVKYVGWGDLPKTEYVVGQSFDPTGLTLWVGWTASNVENAPMHWTLVEDVTTMIICNSDFLGFDPENDKFDTVGETFMVIGYRAANGSAASAKLPITVIEKKIESIEITTLPTKLTYKSGEKLDTTGMVITATYNDGSKLVVENEKVTFEYDFSKIAEKTTVKATFEGVSATFEATVITGTPKLLKMEITKMPTKLEYYSDQDLKEEMDFTGMEVLLTYDDGSTRTCTEGFVVKSVDGNKIWFTINLMGYLKDLEVTIIEAKVTGIEIETLPTKKDYFVGDTFVSEGMVVNAVYNSGRKEAITDYTVEADLSKAGDATVKVVYGEFSAECTVTVEEVKIVSIEITTPATLLEYFQGYEFDPTGMVVTAIYNNGKKVVVKDYQLAYDFTEAGKSQVQVIYEGVSASFDVTVKELLPVSITVTTPPTKTVYKIGETFAADGIVITVTYNDGSLKVFEGEAEITCEALTTAGKKTVTVAALGFTTTFEITVEEEQTERKVVSIAIVSLPNKTEYKKGDTFLAAGLKIEVTYDDGTTETKTSGWVITGATEDDMSSAGKKTVTVEYGGKTASFEINVKSNTVLVIIIIVAIVVVVAVFAYILLGPVAKKFKNKKAA